MKKLDLILKKLHNEGFVIQEKENIVLYSNISWHHYTIIKNGDYVNVIFSIRKKDLSAYIESRSDTVENIFRRIEVLLK